jgi:TP901 family phage tail tape measure protein
MSLTVAQLVARVTADTSGFYKSMAVMNSSLVRTGGLAGRIFAGVGLATGAAGIMSLRAAGNYQQAMNILAATSGAGAAGMKKLDAQAIALGRDFKLPSVSAKDAADAMTELGKAGLSVKDILAATRGTLQLAVAGNIAFTDSAKIVSKTLKAFQLDGGAATKIANLLSAGVNASTAEMDDLAYGMQNASAQFEGAGYSVDTLVVALSALVDRGLSGEQAGTALKVMLQRLESPTKKAAALMDDLGVHIADASGKILPLPNIVAQLTKGFKELNPIQRQQALNTIFGARANQAMAKLLGIGAKGWEDYKKRIVGTNSAQKIAEARTKGFNGALNALGSAVETLGIQLGKELLPVAEKLIRKLAAFVDGIDPAKVVAFFRAIKDNMVALYDMVAGSDKATIAVKSLVLALGSMFIMVQVANWVLALRAAFVALSASLWTNPIVLIVAALVALGYALYQAYQRNAEFRRIVNETFAYLRDVVLPILIQFGRKVIETFNNIKATVGPILTQLKNNIMTVFNAIAGFIRTNQEAIKQYLSAAWKIISTVIATQVRNIISIIKIFAAIFRGDWSTVWTEIKAITSRMLQQLVTVVKGFFSLFLAAGKLILAGLWAGIVQGWNFIKLFFSSLGSAIAGFFSGAGSWLIEAGKSIISGLFAGMMQKWETVKGWVTGLGSWIKEHKGPPATDAQLLVQAGQLIMGGLLNGMKQAWNQIQLWLNGRSAKIHDMVTQMQHAVEEATQGLVDAFKAMIQKALDEYDRITEEHVGKNQKLLDSLVSDHDLAEFKKRMADAKQELQDAKNAVIILGGSFKLPTITQSEGESDADFLARKTAEEEAYRQDFIQKQVEANQRVEDAQAAFDELQYEKRKAALEKKAAKEEENWKTQREKGRTSLENQLNDLVKALAEHPGKWRFYQNKVLKVIDSFLGPFMKSGRGLGTAFANGLDQAREDVEKAAKKLAQAAKDYMPSSPAKKGPLSELPDFTDYMLRGFDARPVNAAMQSLVRPSALPINSLAGSGTSLGLPWGSSNQGNVTNQTIIVEGSLIRETDAEEYIFQKISTGQANGRTV